MSGSVVLPADPPVETIPAGVTLYRVHRTKRPANVFNPGPTPAEPVARFSFFGAPTVPALYAADNEHAAIGETLLRDLPDSGGDLPLEKVEHQALSQVVTTRQVKLLRLFGFSYRELGVDRDQITASGGVDYDRTVEWGQAAYEDGLDGVAWMSRHHDSSRAFVFYDPTTIDVPPGGGGLLHDFNTPDGLDWLVRYLTPLNVNIHAT